MKTPLVEVVWTDCYENHSGWMHIREYIEETKEPLIIHTVGYLLLKDKKRVVLSPSADSQKKVSGIWVIPRAVVHSIKRITSGRTRKAPTHHR